MRRFAAAPALALTLALALLAPLPAAAHPHVFIDASFELIFDAAGRLAKIRTRWVYDSLYSLMVTEDRDTPTDAKGDPTPEGMKSLQGFDSVWAPDSDGDLHVTQAKAPVTIGPPTDWSAFWEDGKIGSYHTRAFEPPIDMTRGAVFIQPYDRGYYFYYKVAGPTIFSGRGDCHEKLFEPNLTWAQQELKKQLAAVPPGVSPEVAGYPAVGADFTQTIWVACW